MSGRGNTRIARWALLSLVVLTLTVAAGLSAAAGAGSTPPGTECVDGAQNLGDPVFDDGEPSVKVSQIDPRRLLAVWTRNVWTREASGPRAASPIGGDTILAQRGPSGEWIEEVLSKDSYVSPDPWLDTAPSGVAYVSYMYYDGQQDARTMVRRVVPGRPAGPARAGPQVQDHPSLAVDQRMRLRDRLFLVASGMHALLWVSDDGGLSWGRPRPFPRPLPGFSPIQGATVVASGASAVAVAWIEGTTDERTIAIRAAPVDRATGHVGPAATLALTPGPFDLPFGSHVIPSLSVVRGGAHAGRAYLAWPQRRIEGADVADIYLSSSDGGGATWSAPRRVNDDLPEGGYRGFASVAGRADGSALVAWLDTRDYPAGDSALMYGAQVDAAGNPSANRRLTRCPTYEEEAGTYGDYFNFDASQESPVMVFPNIRRRGEDSDVFLLE